MCSTQLNGTPRMAKMVSFTLSICYQNKKYMFPGASQVAPVVKKLPANAGDVGGTGLNLCRADPLEEEMVTHSSTFAWKMSWTEKSGGL